MESYNHYYFTAQRHRTQKDQLDPPLQLNPKWALQNVGYPPKIHQGQVIVSFLNGKIEAFEEESGEKLWTYQLPNSYNPSTARDGDLLVADQMLITRHGDQLFLIDLSTGHHISQQTVPIFDLRASVWINNNLVSIFVDRDLSGYCFSYDISRREVLWRYKLESIPDFVTMNENKIFLTDKRGLISCLSNDTGRIMWSTSVKEIGSYREDPEETLKDGRVTGVSVSFKDLVIVPVMSNHIAALAVNSGEMRWNRKIEIRNPMTFELYIDGRIYIVDHEHYYCLDATTGNIVFVKNVGENLRKNGIFISTYPAVTEDYIYLSDIYKGVLVAMDRHRGDIVWIHECGAGIPIYHPPVVVNARLYIVDVKGKLYVFEQAFGR